MKVKHKTIRVTGTAICCGTPSGARTKRKFYFVLVPGKGSDVVNGKGSEVAGKSKRTKEREKQDKRRAK
jgi:hypothetical protein